MSDLPVLISTQKPFAVFPLPCPAEESSDRVALVGTRCPPRVNPPQIQRLKMLSMPLIYKAEVSVDNCY